MAWITPIINWIQSNVLTATDMNRIEGNTQHLYDTKADKGTYDRSSSVLSGANVFSNIVVDDGMVTGTATREITKSDIGLGSVENYGIATQAEAEAGTSNIKYMTPLRVKEEIVTLGHSWITTSIVTGSQSFTLSAGQVTTYTIPLGKTPKQFVKGSIEVDSLGMFFDLNTQRTLAIGVPAIRNFIHDWVVTGQLFNVEMPLDGYYTRFKAQKIELSGTNIIVTIVNRHTSSVTQTVAYDLQVL